MEILKSTEPTLLSSKAVYQIDGILYRFVHRDDEGRSPKFIFRPLGGQRRKADLKLNQAKIYCCVLEVSSLYGQYNSEIAFGGVGIQLSLF